MGLTDYGENLVLQRALTGTGTVPTTYYFALLTGALLDDNSNVATVEVANSNAYARESLAKGAGQFSVSGAVCDLVAALDWSAAATGSWGTVSHWAIYDSATHNAGNAIWSGAFASSLAVTSGMTPQIPANVDLTIGGDWSAYAANLILLDLFNSNQTWPTTYYAALSVAGTEPATGDNYARKAVAWTVTAARAGNTALVQFDTASASWGTITLHEVWDSATRAAGNQIFTDTPTGGSYAVGNGVAPDWAADAVGMTQG